MVTGQPSTSTFTTPQSETAINVSDLGGGNRIITVAYNDETNTNGKVVYTSTDRTVLSGASLMGWSYSTDGGQTWTHGGDVKPPDGWAVLWGDPAITNSSVNQKYVFMSNLAIPNSKMPAGGLHCDTADPGCMYASPYGLGGACIARSTDGGKHFDSYQCVTNNSDFYDGGSMIDAGDGEIFAAFVDVNTDQIDVWRSPDEKGKFSRLPNPFPGMYMMSHPRLRADRGSNAVYVAAQADNGQVLINRWIKGNWGSNHPIAATLYPILDSTGNAVIYPPITLSDRSLRTGPQFSYDFGAPSEGGGDEIRFVYTSNKDSKYLYVRGSFCPADLSSPCKDAPEWGTTPGNLNITGDQFNPSVRAFAGGKKNPAIWKVTYLSREHDPNGNTVSVEQGNLAVLSGGVRVLVPFDQITGLLVCPDDRGYWGDYNDIQFWGVPKNSVAAQFISTYTDSSQGCPRRWEFTSEDVHVSSTEQQ
jgi:hypothetical protein